MRRGILIGAAIAVAAVVAIPLWLAIDDGGDRRAAALVEPTAGGADVGKLTLTGQVSGPLVMPVRSFSWGIKVPHSLATGQASGQARYQWLELIKPIDATSPVLFSMLDTNESLTSAKLELQTQGGTGAATTYLTYTFANPGVANWDDTTSETLKLTFQSVTTAFAKAARPMAPASQVIGQMTMPSISANPVPIVAFSTGVISPRDPATGLPTGKRQHKPVVVRRAIDGLTGGLLAKVGQSAVLGTITIELRRPNTDGTVETYAKYTYRNAVPAAVEDAGAAGGLATQELQFMYQEVDVEIGSALATSEWATPSA